MLFSSVVILNFVRKCTGSEMSFVLRWSASFLPWQYSTVFFSLPIGVILSQAYYNSMFPTSAQWTQELAGWKEGTQQWAFL
jgi:hypothetical protein